MKNKVLSMCLVQQVFSVVCCGGETHSKFSKLEDHTRPLVSACGRPAAHNAWLEKSA